jgi:hypothetical protein
MRIDRRLVLIGVMLIVLSMTMATQYANTKISYSFQIVHPSNADIRFIGSDNSSDDGLRCLRVLDNDSASVYLSLNLGELAPNSTMNYTAAFGIVNEENFTLNITHFTITGENTSYFDIWVHGNRTEDYPDEGDCPTRVMVIEDGSANYNINSCVWQLYAGDMNVSTMCADPNIANPTQLDTLWDEQSHVQYSTNNQNNSVNGTSDFVWVGISVTVPHDAILHTATGTLTCYFKADE